MLRVLAELTEDVEEDGFVDIAVDVGRVAGYGRLLAEIQVVEHQLWRPRTKGMRWGPSCCN